jgi:hypothetical protein
MEFKGRYITRNGTLVAVHLNPAASKGNREERYLGHSVPIPSKDIELQPFKICWNENGEAVWLQGIVDDTNKYDLMQSCEGTDRYSRERGIRVSGCKECEG